MILISDLRQEILLVGITSKKMKDCWINDDGFLVYLKKWGAYIERIERLPPGSWKIEGICSEVGEDVWRGIVEPHNKRKGWWRDYSGLQDEWLSIARESGLSLVKSKNLNGERTLLITKK